MQDSAVVEDFTKPELKIEMSGRIGGLDETPGAKSSVRCSVFFGSPVIGDSTGFHADNCGASFSRAAISHSGSPR
jgi:hypothetical protein